MGRARAVGGGRARPDRAVAVPPAALRAAGAYPAIALLAARGWDDAPAARWLAVHALMFLARARRGLRAGLDGRRLGVHDRRARRDRRRHPEDERAGGPAAGAAVVGVPAARRGRRARRSPRGAIALRCRRLTRGRARSASYATVGDAGAAAAQRGQRARPGRRTHRAVKDLAERSCAQRRPGRRRGARGTDRELRRARVVLGAASGHRRRAAQRARLRRHAAGGARPFWDAADWSGVARARAACGCVTTPAAGAQRGGPATGRPARRRRRRP